MKIIKKGEESGNRAASTKYSKVKLFLSYGAPQDCEMLGIPQLDNWLTDGGKVVSPTHQPQFTTQIHYFSISGRG
jgi:hypothetical protein